jgi:chemotaxis protein methyltransferase CheR
VHKPDHPDRSRFSAASRGGSGYSVNVLGLSDAAFNLLRDLIEQRVGVYFDESKRGLLSDKLADLVVANGLTSFLDYYYLLRHDPDADRHWARLLDRLAVPETYFWRQAEQFEVLARVLAPRHFRKRPNRPLRIWSAACCTGEEPLSIAIALAEAGLLDSQEIQITATDASGAMLDRAKAGLYGERSFRALPVQLRQKYFVPEGSAWRVDPRVASHVEWGTANLAEPSDIARFADADVIFCRNVFIYFSEQAIRRAVRGFADHMPNHGWLFLGASESLARVSADFELQELDGAFAYAKPGHPEVLPSPLSLTARVLANSESPAA